MRAWRSVELYDPAAHEPLTDELWDEVRAREGIADIVENAVTGAGAAGFWPLHPLDGPETLPPEPTTLYIGAAGMISAFGRSRRRAMPRCRSTSTPRS